MAKSERLLVVVPRPDVVATHGRVGSAIVVDGLAREVCVLHTGEPDEQCRD